MSGGEGGGAEEVGAVTPAPAQHQATFEARWISSRTEREALARMQVLTTRMSEGAADQYVAQTPSNYQFHHAAGAFVIVAHDVVVGGLYQRVPGIAVVFDGRPKEFEGVLGRKPRVTGAGARCNGQAHDKLQHGQFLL